jgi:hypothetical protein
VDYERWSKDNYFLKENIMSKRITTYTGSKYYVNVRYYSDIEEYKATLYRLADNDIIGEYFTDDLGEALMTGEAMLKRAESATIIR